VVSNPPYVASAEIDTLAAEVRDHDPRHALDGGADGLAAYRSIVADAPRLLAPAGHLVLEVGAGQEATVSGLFASAGLGKTAARPDLAGIMRALAAGPVSGS
jgi:release factor glutamine methyltransferase